MCYIFQSKGQLESYHEKSQPQSASCFNAGPQCELVTLLSAFYIDIVLYCTDGVNTNTGPSLYSFKNVRCYPTD